MKAPFPIDEFLTGISIAYRNNVLIADAVLPRVPVGKQEFKWNEYAQEERYTIPNTMVGRTSRVNEIEFGATERTSSTDDYGLEDPIPQNDILNAFEGHSPINQAAEALTDLIMLDREVRVARTVFNPASYPASRQAVLGASDQFTNPDSNPQSIIMDVLDMPLMRPNIAIIGRAAFTKLAQHPKIQKAVHGNNGDAGVATRAQIAALFELEELLVGEGFVNIKKPGQPAQFARVWGDSMAFHYRSKLANTRTGVSWGYTAQWGDRIAGQWEDKNIGLRGGQRVRVGESVKEVVVAPDVGYLLSDTNAG